MVTEIVLDVLLSDGTRGMVSNQLGKSVYSHCAGLKLKLKTLKSEKQLKKKSSLILLTYTPMQDTRSLEQYATRF